MLKYVPMGNRRTQIGLELQKAWFKNGCLFNSELWSGLTENYFNELEVIDSKIFRVITGAQAKVLLEMLYLETSQIPIKHVISVRRLMYWHTLFKKKQRRAYQSNILFNEKQPTKRRLDLPCCERSRKNRDLSTGKADLPF